MSNEDFKQIEDFLTEHPGAIAAEIGVSPVIMNRLEAEGRIIRIGKRDTGKRGRPPVEWALPGHADEQDEEAAAAFKLPNLVDDTFARQFATDDEIGTLDYYQKVFDGYMVILTPGHPNYGEWTPGIRQGEEGERDYKFLQGCQKDLVNKIARRGGKKVS